MDEVIIRAIRKEDIDHAKEYTDFVNAFIEEDAAIGLNEKISLE